MQFLNPSAFYLIALIPIVVLMHFLKLRRQRHIVPSVMLWLGAIEDMKANVPFQRLRNSLLLILQVLFLIIIVVSIARPAFRQLGVLTGQSILIIDNSASMQSTELGKTRLELAKTEAIKHINRLDPNGQMMVINTARPPHHIRQPFTSDKAKLRRAVADLPAQHTAPDLTSIFASVRSYADAPNTSLFFISDTVEQVPVSFGGIQKISVGGPADNVGIVQFSVTHNLDEYQLLMGVQNFGNTEKEIRVQLGTEGRWFVEENISLATRETESILFPVDDKRLEGKIITARLELEDDLSVDNLASAILHPPTKWEVLLVSNRNGSLLNHMLETNPRVEVSQIQPHEYNGVAGRDIAIFDRFVPDVLPDGNAIFLNPVDGLPFMPTQKNTQTVRIIEQNTHDVMRDVSLLDLQVKESLICEEPEWGTSLVNTPSGPLIWLGVPTEGGDLAQNGGLGKVVVFAFDPFNLESSRFALSIPCMILMSQCLEWLGSATAPIQPDVVKVGEPVKIRLNTSNAVDRVTVQLPDGTRTPLVARAHPIIFTETTQIGVYTIFVDDAPFGRFVANLLNPTESDLAPPKSEDDSQQNPSTEDPVEQVQHQPEVNREIWAYVAAFGLLLLAAEWWIYHRNPA
jgi:hypothetical protein